MSSTLHSNPILNLCYTYKKNIIIGISELLRWLDIQGENAPNQNIIQRGMQSLRSCMNPRTGHVPLWERK